MQNSDPYLQLRKYLNFAFVHNPVGTTLGVLFGFILNSIFLLFIPILKSNISGKLAWKSLGIVFWTVLSVFFVNYFQYRKRDEIPESIRNVLTLIDEQEQAGKITKEQAHFQRHRLISATVENVTIQRRNEAEAVVNAGKEPENDKSGSEGE